MQITNRSPYGQLDVPLLRCTLEAGETTPVTEEQAYALLPQLENFEPADDEAKAVAADLADVLGAINLVESLNGEAPPKNALRLVWVEFARRRGDEDPDSKTRAQLISLYGPQDPDPAPDQAGGQDNASQTGGGDDGDAGGHDDDAGGQAAGDTNGGTQ